MNFKTIALLASGLLAACGSETKKSEQPAPAPEQQDQGVNVQATVDQETAKALPTMMVARVPLDAQGNELVEQGEARQAFGPTAAASGDSASVVFDQAAKVTIAEELDRDSSSAQWGGFYWNTPWYPGKLLGRGLWWGRNPYAYRNGGSYGYNYTSSYRYNNCNYYTYYPSYGRGYDSYSRY